MLVGGFIFKLKLLLNFEVIYKNRYFFERYLSYLISKLIVIMMIFLLFQKKKTRLSDVKNFLSVIEKYFNDEREM